MSRFLALLTIFLLHITPISSSTEAPSDAPTPLTTIPDTFRYLSEIDPSIIQEMRYAQSHNFVGRPIASYNKPECILAKEAAEALRRVQQRAKALGYTLKVYDCYRPTSAVEDFWNWAHNPNDIVMKKEFYPHMHHKPELFENGYIAKKSGHSRGSTIDLTLVQEPVGMQPEWRLEDPMGACDSDMRFEDNMIEMGTGFDCFSPKAHTLSPLVATDETVRKNRYLLMSLMDAEGFENFDKEWWHYTLRDEPFPDTYFDFPVE